MEYMEVYSRLKNRYIKCPEVSVRRLVWLELREDRSDQRMGSHKILKGLLASGCSPPCSSIKLGMWVIHPTVWLRFLNLIS